MALRMALSVFSGAARAWPRCAVTRTGGRSVRYRDRVPQRASGASRKSGRESQARRQFQGEAGATGASAASDAFFPFPDGPQLLLDAGVSAIVQPGGSMRDAEVLGLVERAGAAMLITGTRHFRH